ncbi:MAG: response regulator [Steroidobacteraceae bacterium]
MLEHLLGAWGLRHASASGADEALRMLDAAHASGDGYALAILDQEMPGRDGVQLARAIRAHPALTGMRLVMLSSVSDTVAELRGADGGIDAFLTKPARQAALYREICRVLGVQQGDTALRASAPPAAEERLRFAGRALLAEDNAVNQLIARQMLESMGLQVDVAGDGRAAVEALRSAQLRYDVVLMDCEMPELDGRSATQQWRRIESTLGGQPRVPIIALTAHAADSDRLACLAAGMDDYLSKPMTRRQLGETLARWCRPLEAPPASGDMTERAPRAGAASG